MNTVLIEIKSKNLSDEKPFSGKVYGWQTAGLLKGEDYPTPIKVNVEKGHEYEPGKYAIDPRSYIADEMGNLKIKRLKLLPISGASK